jgi:hypothetical protein
MTECRMHADIRYIGSYLNIKLQIPGKSFLLMRQAANSGESEGSRICPGQEVNAIIRFCSVRGNNSMSALCLGRELNYNRLPTYRVNNF